jgi:AcrR family transcriptional regulator
MRITEDAKIETRKNILARSRALFKEKGFDAVTTRDIAKDAGIATGTLFNYFPTKEAIAVTLVSQDFQSARQEFEKVRQQAGTLEEKLFSYIAAGLRCMKPNRSFLEPVLETAFNPLVRAGQIPEADALRQEHVEEIEKLLADEGIERPVPAHLLHLYLSLYSGVLAFWIKDASRNAEDTLALLDQWTKLFVAALSTRTLR